MPGKSQSKKFLFESLDARILFSALPDLTSTDNGFFGLPYQMIAGEYHGVSCNVQNAGTATAGSFVTSLYLSPTPDINSGSFLVGKDVSDFDSLPPGQSHNALVVTNFPPMPAGNYYPIWVIDDGNKIIESNEDNNLVIGSPIEVDAPTADFTMTSVSGLSSQSLTTGIRYNVSFAGAVSGATSENAVDVGFYLSTDTTYSDDDTSIGDASGAIDGSTFSGSATVTVPSMNSGSYYLFAVADSAKNVPETDETNNALLVGKIQVRQSSLIQSSFSSTSFSGVSTGNSNFPTAGYPVSITANLGNVGNGDPIVVTFSLSSDEFAGGDDDIVLGTAQTLPINSSSLIFAGFGASTSATLTAKLPATIPAGDYYLVASADGLDSFVGDKITVHVAKNTPDLALNSLTDSNDSRAGSPGSGSVTVTNLSTFKSAATKVNLYYSADDQLDDSDVLITQVSCPAIDPASSQTLNFNYQLPETLPPGIYHPIAVLDPKNALGDTDRSNNTAASTPLQIVQALDGSITAANDTLLLKSSSSLLFVLSNERTDNINSSYVANFYFSKDDTISADDQLLLSKPIYAQVNSDARGYFNFKYHVPANLPVGIGHVLLKLTAPKSDAAILTEQTQVTVADSASLLRGTAQAVASSAHSTRFRITLTNSTSFNAQGAFNISLFGSDDQLIKTLKKSISVAAGKSKTISLTLRGQFPVGAAYTVQISQ